MRWTSAGRKYNTSERVRNGYKKETPRKIRDRHDSTKYDMEYGNNGAIQRGNHGN